MISHTMNVVYNIDTKLKVKLDMENLVKISQPQKIECVQQRKKVFTGILRGKLVVIWV